MGRKFPEGTEINLGHFQTFGFESQCLWDLPGTPGCASCCPQFPSHGTLAISVLLPSLIFAPCVSQLEERELSEMPVGWRRLRNSWCQKRCRRSDKVIGNSSSSHEAWGIFSLLRIIEIFLAFGSLVMCSLQQLCLEDKPVRNSWEFHVACFITGSYTAKFSLLLPREW